MNKKLGIIFTSFILQTALTEAAITFSEIMYDPEGADSGREWVEVRNDGDASILTIYKFFEGNTNHGITAFQGGNSIPSGGFAIIADNPAKFLADFPDYKGLLFDSSFSLSNAGEFIALKDSSLATLDSLAYSPSLGGGDDSTTLSLLSGSWGRGDATPGADNTLSTKPISSGTSGTSVAALGSSPAPDLNLSLPEEMVLVAGADKEFTGNALTSAGTAPSNMTYEWSFGDGGVRTGKTVLYHYTEPGYYLLTVEASNGLLFAKNRMRVKVIDADIAISHVTKTDEKISIGIKNNASSEIDISSWKIDSGGLQYVIPKNTIVLPKTTTLLNGLELGMSTSTFTFATTSLVFPGGKRIASSTHYLHYGDSPPKREEKKLETVSFQKRKMVEKKAVLYASGVESSEATNTLNVVGASIQATAAKDKSIAVFLKKLWPF